MTNVMSHECVVISVNLPFSICPIPLLFRNITTVHVFIAVSQLNFQIFSQLQNGDVIFLGVSMYPPMRIVVNAGFKSRLPIT